MLSLHPVKIGPTSPRLRTCSTLASASSSQQLRFSSILPGPAAVCMGSVHSIGRVSTTHSLSCCEAANVPSEMLGPEPANQSFPLANALPQVARICISSCSTRRRIR